MLKNHNSNGLILYSLYLYTFLKVAIQMLRVHSSKSQIQLSIVVCISPYIPHIRRADGPGKPSVLSLANTSSIL